jgi:folate-binding protein YgfZ
MRSKLAIASSIGGGGLALQPGRRHMWRMAESGTAAQLSSRAIVAVIGPDWRAFLQGLISQDVETLKPGELRFGALLNPQGKLLFDLFILGRDDGCWLDVAADRRDGLVQRLSIYRLRAKVEIKTVDAAVWAVWNGAKCGDVDPRLAALGRRAYGEAPLGPKRVDETAYHAMRLALGVPDPGKDSPAETDYPIEANFDLLNGIDFKKGCFVGQETTSRMKRRGQVKNRMRAITFDGPPPSFGAEVLADARLRAGEVRTGIDGHAIALLRIDRIEGAALTVEGRVVRVTG